MDDPHPDIARAGSNFLTVDSFGFLRVPLERIGSCKGPAVRLGDWLAGFDRHHPGKVVNALTDRSGRTSRCVPVPSSTGTTSVSAPSSFSACSPTTRNGTCAATSSPVFAWGESVQASQAGGACPRSREFRRRQATRKNREGFPVLGFRDFLEQRGTLRATEIDTGSGCPVSVPTRLTPMQEKAFSLLDLKPHPAPIPNISEARSRQPVQ